jgi:hypothetical protein
MKTTTQVIENSGIPAKLIRSVIRQLGDKDSFEDIYKHGIDGGFHGFIYYSDTVPFFKRNRKEIGELVKYWADALGQDQISLVAGFNCLKPADDETKDSIMRCLGGGRLTDEDTQVANALAWFAAEEVARAFCDE